MSKGQLTGFTLHGSVNGIVRIQSRSALPAFKNLGRGVF
jgi:hypothetical protein